ncbi:hypothetical protein Tco_0354618, partial [Tanacetum coccineum]
MLLEPSICQQLDGSKVEGLCCEKRREQEKIGQQLWKQPWATTIMYNRHDIYPFVL